MWARPISTIMTTVLHMHCRMASSTVTAFEPFDISKVPVNLILAGKRGQDVDLLKYAYEFEHHTNRGVAPPLTPALLSDEVKLLSGPVAEEAQPPITLEVTSAKRVSEAEVEMAGSTSEGAAIEVFVDKKPMSKTTVDISGGQWSARCSFAPSQPPKALYGGYGKVEGQVIVMVLARLNKKALGKLILIDQKAKIHASEQAEKMPEGAEPSRNLIQRGQNPRNTSLI